MTSGPGKTYTLATKSSSASLVRPQTPSSAAKPNGNLALRAPSCPAHLALFVRIECVAAVFFAES